MKTKLKLTSSEMKKYVFDEKRDYEILYKCKQLEKLKISKTDREFVKFLKTQLEKDWRKQMLKKLNNILRKYV